MTTFAEIIERFFHLIEKDKKFFNYNNLTDIEAWELANERALSFLHESIARFEQECCPEVDFDDYDEETQTFNFDLTTIEKIC